MIACGLHHSLFINLDGLVYASGQFNCGKPNQDRKTFCLVHGVPHATQVSGKYGNHAAILDHNGDVWISGKNENLLPGADVEMITVPEIVQNLPKIIMVSCGSKHSIVLDTTGNIWGVGDNSANQLSEGASKINSSKFKRIITPNEMGRVQNISCGFMHTICQSETEDLWGTGYNSHGELGVGHTRNVNRFQRIYLDEDVIIQSFNCGESHTVVLDSNGGAWATGYGYYGQLGHGRRIGKNRLTKIPDIPPVVFIACGGFCTMMIDAEGTVYACGYNYRGQLGMGHSDPIFSPEVVPDLPRIVQGCLSENFSLLVDDDGGMWACGFNTYGQQGRGNTNGTKRFVQVEGVSVNIMSEKRFRHTKRAQ